MAQSKHILLLVRAWGKRSSHSVDRGHAPPAASHSPWPRFVPANISEFLFKSCCFLIFLLHNSFLSIILPTYLLPPNSSTLCSHTTRFCTAAPLRSSLCSGFVFALFQPPSPLCQGAAGQCLGLTAQCLAFPGKIQGLEQKEWKSHPPAAPGLAKGAAATWRSSPSVC